ncbi:MAG TPA: amidase [Candidatus Binataceae bacterium]|nr:amidase [Candidatus Binataceae bacterium]
MTIRWSSPFCDHDQAQIEGAGGGSLADVSFAAKDLYAVAGYRCCAGNCDWLASHPPADTSAPAVSAMLAAGARLVGKTRLDELAWGMTGENLDYGTPANPRAPGRMPGGSSSGSAAAVAGGFADCALGTDTGGSVRVPASYCGIWGIRTTHGRISTQGVIPLAPSFDTVSFFARDAHLLRKVGAVLLAPLTITCTPRRLLIAQDAFAVAAEDAREALRQPLALITGAMAVEVISLGQGELEQWPQLYRTIQSHEAWAAHGQWISQRKPRLGISRERFAQAQLVSAAEVERAAARRAEIGARLDALLGRDGLIAMPAAYSVAPLPQDGEAQRLSNLTLTAAASLCGLPQISLPLAQVDGLPLALSLIGPRGGDEALLALAEQLS